MGVGDVGMKSFAIRERKVNEEVRMLFEKLLADRVNDIIQFIQDRNSSAYPNTDKQREVLDDKLRQEMMEFANDCVADEVYFEGVGL